MYAEDSFFTLSPSGRIGLLALTLFLSVLMLWLTARFRRFRWWGRVIAALVLFWAFVWLSPQIYYAYYLLIFDGLPLQSVIKVPPAPGSIARLLAFQGPANLSAHGQGVLGWAMLGVALRPLRT